MNWNDIFEEVEKVEGATVADITYLQESVLSPLSSEEIAEANSNQRNPFPESDPLHDQYKPFDSGEWIVPRRQFPQSFADFLRWSNGGNFVNGDREFGMFDPKAIREYLLSYQTPEYMPGAVPFALDGGGGFYLFDMRGESVDGEFPIVFAHSGSLGWDEDDHVVVAGTFVDACRGTTHPLD